MPARKPGPARPAAPPVQGRIPIPASVLGRMGGRVLDPAKAGTHGSGPVRPTAYVGNELIVQGPPSATEELVEAARATGHRVGTTSAVPGPYVRRLRNEALAELVDKTWVRRIRLAPDGDRGAPPDAWQVLQKYRETVSDADPGYSVGLNHLIHLTPLIDGSP